MKTKLTIALSLLFALLPCCVSAQKHVDQAFKDFKRNYQTYFTELSRTLNPTTTVTFYAAFELPADKIEAIDDLQYAFKRDESTGYRFEYSTKNSWNLRGRGDYHFKINDRSEYVLKLDQTTNFYLICVEDPENTDYRYCYVMQWDEKDGKIVGTLLASYNKKPLQKRQSTDSDLNLTINGNRINLQRPNDTTHVYSINRYHLDSLGRSINDVVRAAESIVNQSVDGDSVTINGNTIIVPKGNGKMTYNVSDNVTHMSRFGSMYNLYKNACQDPNTSPVTLAVYAEKILNDCKKIAKSEDTEAWQRNLCIKCVKELIGMTKSTYEKGILEAAKVELER